MRGIHEQIEVLTEQNSSLAQALQTKSTECDELEHKFHDLEYRAGLYDSMNESYLQLKEKHSRME